ncbi:MAG TPA: bifunctional o-acetylhomoserine/o-acetylserine sulfhydrylase [Acidimicrobiia bacterium]|nr:bifunctional o-acetylhomoserine/o-acetylserine sulfhydrylase [Acidimicrobiia bacterium]
MADSWGFETKQIHAGAEPDPTTGARAVPIYQTTSFVFRDTAHAAALFGLEELGMIYTRIMNPTQAVFEERMAALEGGVGSLAVASGQAAQFQGLFNLAENGGHLVSSASLYGGTYNQLHYTFPKLGVEVSFVEDPDDLDAWRAAIRPNTKGLYGEMIGNPKGDIFDLEGVAGVAHEHGVPLVIDNTLATPYLCRPLEHGADIVVHSATKFIGGHGTSIGGVIVDGGRFDYAASGNFPNFTEPDPSYHGLVFSQLPEELRPAQYILKCRLQYQRDVGPAISPFNAFLFLQGLETLSLRMERHSENALAIAQWLEARDEVEWVIYPGLASSPWNTRVKKYLPNGCGAIVSFGIKGGREAGQKFVDALELHSHLANVGDVRSLAIHPATTTHSQLEPAEQVSTGVTEDLVRLSVGIESLPDIQADLEAGFRAAKS